MRVCCAGLLVLAGCYNGFETEEGQLNLKPTDLITDAIGKMGENIVVRRFARLAVGDPETTVAVASSGSAE